MGQVNDRMINLLTEFLICEIGSKALDGITYAMLTKDDKDKAAFDRYMEIRKEINKCGFGNNEIFRVYEVSNGYIFDMDLNVAKKITINLAKAVEKTNGTNVGNGDLIGDSPESRRKSDMKSLAKYCQSELKKGNNKIEVALFSRNSVPNIIITGKLPDGSTASIKYNSYAIRHWDIETINSKLLIPANMRIARIEPCEVLPSKTGVKFLLTLEKC